LPIFFEGTAYPSYRTPHHAGAWETSLLWALRPDLVAMDRLPADGMLPGVLGEDPRSGASIGRGQALLATIVERLTELGARTRNGAGPHVRSAHVEVLALQLRLLELIRRDRQTLPRSLVRPLMNEPYLRCLNHFWRGAPVRCSAATRDPILERELRTPCTCPVL
jgi:hypothetical protein